MALLVDVKSVLIIVEYINSELQRSKGKAHMVQEFNGVVYTDEHNTNIADHILNMGTKGNKSKSVKIKLLMLYLDVCKSLMYMHG